MKNRDGRKQLGKEEIILFPDTSGRKMINAAEIMSTAGMKRIAKSIVNSATGTNYSDTDTINMGYAAGVVTADSLTWDRDSGTGELSTITGGVVINVDGNSMVFTSDTGTEAIDILRTIIRIDGSADDSSIVTEKAVYDAIINAVQADTLFTWDASVGSVPVQRPDTTPVQSGDRFEVTVGGTIAGLDPYEVLKPGDLLVARIDGASVTADYFSTQGNIDNATLTQAILGAANDNIYMTPYTNVERVYISDATVIARIIDEGNRYLGDYSASLSGMYKHQVYIDSVNEWRYEFDGTNLTRTNLEPETLIGGVAGETLPNKSLVYAVQNDEYLLDQTTYTGEFLDIDPQSFASGSFEDLCIAFFGRRMYVIQTDSIQSLIHQYNLGGQRDISTGTFIASSPNLSSLDTQIQGVFMNDTNDKIYIVGTSTDSVYELSLGAAGDITTLNIIPTAVLDVNASGGILTPQGVTRHPNGYDMFVVSTFPDKIVQYKATVAWDLSTATYYGEIATPNTFYGIWIPAHGTEFLVMDLQTERIFSYSMEYLDITTASFNATPYFYAGSQQQSVRGMFGSPDGTKLHVIGTSPNEVTQYDSVLDARPRFFKTDANDSAKHEYIGVVKEYATNGSEVEIYTHVVKGMTDLSAGTEYYMSDTAGGISDVPGEFAIKVGTAISSTQLLIKQGDDASQIVYDNTFSGLDANNVADAIDEINAESVKSITLPVSLAADTGLIVTHGFNNTNIIVEARNSNSEIVDVEIYDISYTTFKVRTAIAGNYIITVHRGIDNDSTAFVAVSTGLQAVNINTMALGTLYAVGKPGEVSWVNGSLYIGDSVTGLVSKINESTGATEASHASGFGGAYQIDIFTDNVNIFAIADSGINKYDMDLNFISFLALSSSIQKTLMTDQKDKLVISQFSFVGGTCGITVVDVATFTIDISVNLGLGSIRTPSEYNNQYYVPYQRVATLDYSIKKYNKTTLALEGSIPLVDRSYGMIIVGDIAYVGETWLGYISIIDLVTELETSQIVMSEASMFGYYNNMIYAAGESDAILTEIDANTSLVTGRAVDTGAASVAINFI